MPSIVGYAVGIPLEATAENLALPQDFLVLVIAVSTLMAPLGVVVVWFGAEMAGLAARSLRKRLP